MSIRAAKRATDLDSPGDGRKAKHGRPGAQDGALLVRALERVADRCRELVEQVVRAVALDWEPEACLRQSERAWRFRQTRHEAEAAEARANAERALASELDSHEPERLVARRHQRKVAAREDGWRERGEDLRRQRRQTQDTDRLGADASGIECHEAGQLGRRKTAIEVQSTSAHIAWLRRTDRGPASDELNPRVFLQQHSEHVGDQVDALLLGPPADKDEAA